MARPGWRVTERLEENPLWMKDDSEFHYYKKGIIHAVREKDNGRQVLGMYNAHLKVMTHCGHWMPSYGMGVNVSKAILWDGEQCAMIGSRPCGQCYQWPREEREAYEAYLATVIPQDE